MKRINFNEIFNVKKMPELLISEIDKVYIGKPNMCMCGCSGEYYEDDKKKNVILNKFKRNEEKGIEVITDNDAYIFTIFIGKSQYTIYTN